MYECMYEYLCMMWKRNTSGVLIKYIYTYSCVYSSLYIRVCRDGEVYNGFDSFLQDIGHLPGSATGKVYYLALNYYNTLYYALYSTLLMKLCRTPFIHRF